MKPRPWARRIVKIVLVLVFSVIASLAVAGMIASIVRALGVQSGLVLALISLPPGVGLGLLIALPLSEQLLQGGEGDMLETRNGSRRARPHAHHEEHTS